MQLLQDLTNLASTIIKFKWNSIEQKVFDTIKLILTRYMLLFYPCFIEQFDINVGGDDVQSGTEMIHNGKPTTLTILN